jgi:hypothetical protein
VFFVILLAVPPPCLADVVLLLTGEQVEGQLANRDIFREDPKRQRSLTIVLNPEGDTYEFRSFDISQIRMVILEDDGVGVFFDMVELLKAGNNNSVTPPKNPTYPASQKSSSKTRETGVGLLISGAVCTGFGAFVKMGEDELKITDSEITTENTYGTANYVLIGVGAVLMITGIILATKPSNDSIYSNLLLDRRKNAGTMIGIRFRF